MNDAKKVEVCAYCSGFDVKELKGLVKAKVGCIGKCAKKCPELQGKVYGFLNGVFTVCETKAAFLAKIAALGAYSPSSQANPLVDAFLAHVEQWGPEFAALREIALACGLTEELKWGQPCYLFQNGNLAILGGFKDYIALSFFKGALLKDPLGILVRQTQNVQAARQLRFTSVQGIAEREAVIKAYLQEAIAIEKAGLTVPAEQKPELDLPEELRRKFEESPALQAAFFALTPGRQRGYLFHFAGAKQAQTRVARIDKCTPRILAGKGIDE